MTEKRPVHGLLARCFAEEHGDEVKTKARYVMLRAIEIETDEAVRARDEVNRAKKREREVTAEKSAFTEEKAKRLEWIVFAAFVIIGLVSLVSLFKK